MTTQQSAAKSRAYRMGKRAEKQQDTRRRIVEAAVELHGTCGPARTTVSQIAERAGVQRHTFYAHFPDDRSLYVACSGLTMERDPLPDFSRLRSLPAGGERLRAGLHQLYDWYRRNAQLVACVLRDAEYHALTRQMVEVRMGPVFREARAVLGEAVGDQSSALLDVALDFRCWQRLAETYDPEKASALMSEAVTAVAKEKGRAHRKRPAQPGC